MKLTNHQNALKTNVTNVQSQNFGIGDASVVIDILRNRLYKNKIQTLVQEYICNGRDAMREVKSNEKIKITCPSKLDPTFRVRDFGPGISPDRMANVFVLYGASTKRDTNDQTGGFGIGAKSAWSYTDSFTIITYIDGTKRTYIAHTGTNNNGSLDLINTEKTTEKNGTEIQIGVNPDDIYSFKNAINRCIYFWESGYELHNMEDYSFHITGTVYKNLIEHSINYDSNIIGYFKVLALIDGVPYRLDSFTDKIPALAKIRSIFNNQGLIVHLPNGIVEVSASREEISDSDLTIKNLTTLFDKAHEALDKEIKSKFKGAKNTYDYLNIYMDLSQYYNLNDYSQYDKYKMRQGKISSGLFKKVKMVECSYKKGKLNKYDLNTVKYSRWSQPLNVVSKADNLFYASKDLSAVQVGKHLRAFLDQGKGSCILISENGDSAAFDKLIKDLKFTDISTVPVIKKTATKIKVERSSQEFCLHRLHGYPSKYYTTLDANTKVYYYYLLKDNPGRLIHYANFFNINICGVSESTYKIIKDNENFKSLNDLINNYKPTLKHLKFYIRTVLDNKDLVDKFNYLDDLNDPKIKHLKRVYSKFNGSKCLQIQSIPEKYVDMFKNHKLVKIYLDIDKTFDILETKYPLISKLYDSDISRNKEELEFYVNAKFEKEGK